MVREVIGLVTLVAAIAAGAALGLDTSTSQQDLEILRGADAPQNATWIDSLDLTKMVQRRQTPRAGRSLAGGRGGRRGAGDGPAGAPITLGGLTYQHGIGTLSISGKQRNLGMFSDRFAARVPAHGAMLGKVERER